MPNSKGIITRKDVIEEEALNWGPDYQKQVQIAIDSNQKWVKSIKDIYDAQQSIRAAQNNTDFIKAKQQEALATQRIIAGIKEQEAAEITANKIKISAIAVSEAERKAKLAALDAENKVQKAKESAKKRTSEEIFDQGVLARNAKNLAIINSKLASEYEKLTAKKRIAATALQNLIIAGKKADETQNQYNARLRVAQHEFDELHRRVVAANRAVSVFNDNVGNYPRQAAQGIRDLVEAFGFVVGIDTFVNIAKQAFDIVRNFEAEMVNLAAIAGFTREEIAPLEADIREVAKASINSATDVAKLATELIKLGSTPEEVSNLLKPVNDLSIALQASAEDSATLVKSLLNAYQEGSEKAAHFTDVLAESANRSALDFEGLRDAFSYVAPVANTLGISVERTAALIGTLADNGIKAESAGRLLSTGLGRLAGQGLTLEKALKQITDAQDSGKDSLEVLTVANKLFGTEAGKLALILANNKKKIDDSTLAYENSGGALEELTEKQLKSINSELEILSSAWEEYLLDSNEAIGGTKAMTSVLSFLSSNLKEIIDLAVFAGSSWLAYKSALFLAEVQTKLVAWATTLSTTATVANTAATVTNTVATTTDTIAEDANTSALMAQILALEGNTAAEVANTVATEAGTVATTAATGAMARFNAVVKANALLLILTLLAGVIYLYNKFTTSLEDNYKELKRGTDEFLKAREAASKNGQSVIELSDRYDELTKKSKLSIDEQKELNKIIQLLADTVPDATTAMDKYGNAIAVNTVKTREYVKSRNEMIKAENALKLEQNIKLLGDLRKEQENLNFTGNKYKLALLEFGGIYQKNGMLMLQSNSFFKEDTQLTKEQLALYTKKKFQNEEAIANTIAQIQALKGLTQAQKEAIALREQNAKEQAKNAPRTIEIIDAEIKALEDSVKYLSDKTGREGNIIKAKIKALNQERDLIYNNNKAQDKDNEKLIRKQLEQQKRLRDAIYNLNQFRLQNAIDANQRIIDDEKRTIERRIEAYTENEQLRQSKNLETLEYELLNNALEGKELEKLTAKKRKLFFKSTYDRIEAITTGKLAVEKMTAAELLILEKYNAEKKNLELQSLKDKQTIIDSEVDQIKKRIDFELLAQDTRLQKALEAENILYNASLNRFTDLEKAQEEHERKIFEIKRSFAREGLATQIKAIEDLLKAQDKLPENERISSEKRKQIENELAKLRKENSDIDVETNDIATKKKLFFEEEYFKKVEDLSRELTSALGNLGNAIFEGRVQNIEAEQAKNDEYYNRQIDLAKNDERQKDILQKERDKKNDALEKKKRKEQEKQAIFNKSLAIAEAGMNTAKAVTAALTAGPGIGLALAVITAAVAAVQLAAIVATPIPKYKKGRKGGPEEIAMINDGIGPSGGYVQEVIERKSGAIEMPTGKNKIVQLFEGDTVHKSVGDFNSLQRASMMASLNMQGKKMTDFQASQYFEASYGKELVEEMKLTRKAIQNQKQPVIYNEKVDINHHLWKMKNTNWN